jgi:peptidyl-prolyl cis-trans isomerase B (cyclophilin B)
VSQPPYEPPYDPGQSVPPAPPYPQGGGPTYPQGDPAYPQGGPAYPQGGPPGPGYAQPGPPVPPPTKNRRSMKIVLISVAVVVALCLGAGCIGLVAYYYVEVKPGDPPGTTDSAPSPQSLDCQGSIQPAQPETRAVGLPDFAKAPQTGTATMRIGTSLGPIEITMDRARTPCTVASFRHLAEKKFFDQSVCHRLVTEGIFVLQCGDPSGTGQGGPDYRFADENLGGTPYTRGVVAMANTGSPATNGSQFFIIFQDSTSLPPQYTPFGQVSTGLDVVDRVAAGGHDNSISAGGGKPRLGITIQTLTVD